MRRFRATAVTLLVLLGSTNWAVLGEDVAAAAAAAAIGEMRM